MFIKCKKKKFKRPFKRINRSYGDRVKKTYIEDGRLFFGEGQKGRSFGSVLASLIPSLIEPVAKLFGGEKLKRRRRKIK